MPFRHVVMFEFADHVEDDFVDRVRSGLNALPGQIDEIRSYLHGSDVGISETSWDYALVADFDNLQGYITYRDHPAHVLFIQEVINGNMKNRASVQYQFGGH